MNPSVSKQKHKNVKHKNHLYIVLIKERLNSQIQIMIQKNFTIASINTF